MRKLQDTRFVISGIFGFVSPLISNEFLQNALKNSIAAKFYREAAIFGILLFIASIAVKLSIIIYDKWIWKFLHSKLDISGYWQYVNEYEDARNNTTGFVKVEQSPFYIKISEGKSAPGSASGQYTSTMRSLALDFISEDSLFMAYEVSRNQDGKPRMTKKSLEELKIVQRKGFWSRPIKMETKFWNCKRSSSEDQAIKNNPALDIWPITTGTSTYLKSTKKDFDKS